METTARTRAVIVGTTKYVTWSRGRVLTAARGDGPEVVVIKVRDYMSTCIQLF